MAQQAMAKWYFFLSLLLCCGHRCLALAHAPILWSTKSHRCSGRFPFATHLELIREQECVQSLRSRFLSSRLAMSPTESFDEYTSVRKIEGRRKRVMVGYRVVSMGYAIFSCLVLRGGLNTLTAYALSGPVMAAGISYTLVGAVRNDRLSSDTYKRLNLALILYGFCGCLSAYFMPRFRMAAWMVPSFVAIVNSVKGYCYGVKGWKLESSSVVGDIVHGTRDSFRILLEKPKNATSAGYLIVTLFSVVLALLKLGNVADLALKKAVPFSIGARLLRFSKLAMLTTVSLTLKDAADRDRLEGSTFIQLNILTSAMFGAMAVYVQNGNTITPVGSAPAALTALIAGSFSVFTATTGIVSQINKKEGTQ